ncbi:hypothetical protein JW823_10390 [bacterium]|nr:hypothetical protein [candidate division CSSED10-310 bacterium]
MKKVFLHFYFSRALLSSIFSVFIMGITWKALFLAISFFGLFLLYLHSGWFSIDLNHPFMPLRRDPRGLEIQRKALLASVISGLFINLFSSQLTGLTGFSLPGNVAVSIGIITYFVTQFILFIRA